MGSTAQVSKARPGIFCKRIRDTDYYAPDKTEEGTWLQDNGVALDNCLLQIGSREFTEAYISSGLE